MDTHMRWKVTFTPAENAMTSVFIKISTSSVLIKSVRQTETNQKVLWRNLGESDMYSKEDNETMHQMW